tara:strand:+ start:1362 stop:1787 length:426 start_codon:yes stop_codon:yes gene_type:complete
MATFMAKLGNVTMAKVYSGLKRKSWKCNDCQEPLTSHIPGFGPMQRYYDENKDGFYALKPDDHFAIGLHKSTKSGGRKYNKEDELDWDNIFFLCSECDSKRAEKKTITIRIRKEDYIRLQNKSNGKVIAKIKNLIDDFLKG